MVLTLKQAMVRRIDHFSKYSSTCARLSEGHVHAITPLIRERISPIQS